MHLKCRRSSLSFSLSPDPLSPDSSPPPPPLLSCPSSLVFSPSGEERRGGGGSAFYIRRTCTCPYIVHRPCSTNGFKANALLVIMRYLRIDREARCPYYGLHRSVRGPSSPNCAASCSVRFVGVSLSLSLIFLSVFLLGSLHGGGSVCVLHESA